MYNKLKNNASTQASLIVKVPLYGKRDTKNSFYLRRRGLDISYWISNNSSICKRFQKAVFFVATKHHLYLNLPTETKLRFAATLRIVKEWFYKIGQFANDHCGCSDELIVKNGSFPHFSGLSIIFCQREVLSMMFAGTLVYSFIGFLTYLVIGIIRKK